jgi:hypothetical protein
MLTQHLREMEDEGIVVRSDLSDRGSQYAPAQGNSLCSSESFHSQLTSGISILHIFYMPGNAAGSRAASPFRGFNPQNLAQLKVYERFGLSRHLESNLPADLIDGRSPVLCFESMGDGCRAVRQRVCLAK